MVICRETAPQSVSEPLSAASERGSANQNQSSGRGLFAVRWFCKTLLSEGPLLSWSSFFPLTESTSVQHAPPPAPQPAALQNSERKKGLAGPSSDSPGCQADAVLARCQEHPRCLPWKSPQPSLTPHGLPSVPWPRPRYVVPSEHEVLSDLSA